MSHSGLTAYFTLWPWWGLSVKCESHLFQRTFMGINWWNVFKMLGLLEYSMTAQKCQPLLLLNQMYWLCFCSEKF